METRNLLNPGEVALFIEIIGRMKDDEFSRTLQKARATFRYHTYIEANRKTLFNKLMAHFKEETKDCLLCKIFGVGINFPD